jgi:D-alanyl-lipoteichoic acid acyltransferase DltB (MBOAT superfamily)
MIFTSYTYVLFLAAAFVVHWLLPVRARKPFLIAASYVFYGSWDWRFAFLLLGLSIFNWAYARSVLARPEPGRLWPGILVNLTPLLVFKYTGFFYENAAAVGNAFGAHWASELPFSILLPLGISFFTFQGIAYLIDVATGEEPFGFVDFLLYKALWPQLIAGPIVRPGEIRDDIQRMRAIDYDDCAYGAQRILFGFVKKVILADSIAPVVDSVFASSRAPNAIDIGVAIFGFGLQIYFDFSAYSDIAIGSARLFGFRFPENFDWPYAARSPQDFWNRWHMTLSRWIRDYVFTPLAFATRHKPKWTNVWLLVAMAAVGLWHGAQWTFVLWGVWHGLMLVLNQTALKRFFERARASRRSGVIAWLLTFSVVTIGWLLFRAESVAQVADYLRALATFRGGIRPSTVRVNGILLILLYFAGLVLMQLTRAKFNEWSARQGSTWRVLHALRPLGYVFLIVAVIVLDQEAKAFVYFQF